MGSQSDPTIKSKHQMHEMIQNLKDNGFVHLMHSNIAKEADGCGNLSFQSEFCTQKQITKGPFKYYVSKKVGGWGQPNAYVCLQGGWVGLEKCLRNHKNTKKDQMELNERLGEVALFEFLIPRYKFDN